MAGVPVLDAVPGQEYATGFLSLAVARPHHAYVLAGPEGGGKQQAARAFVAALLCHRGGCGTCRDCRLALDDRHPNGFVVEPEGRDIHVDTIREEVWHPAHRTAPEPGRKVFVIREADRLNAAAADVLLKVLEEPPSETIFLLLTARPDELPETILSRCHVVVFRPLAESLIVATLVDEGAAPDRARLAARLSGGNLGRARRMALHDDALSFRGTARDALAAAADWPAGALAAADLVVADAERFRKGLKDLLDEELAPFVDARGRPDDAYRGAVRRIRERHARRERRAERDHVDRVLMAISTTLRDAIAISTGCVEDILINVDERPTTVDIASATRALDAVERARADLASDLNRNVKLVLESAFLAIGRDAAA